MSSGHRHCGRNFVDNLKGSIHEVEAFLAFDMDRDPREDVDIDFEDRQFTLGALVATTDRLEMRPSRAILRKLQATGAIHAAGSHKIDGSTQTIWEWDRDAYERLTEYLSEMDRLPCSCRAHIPSGRDAPEGYYACNHCGAEHSREIIKRAME